MTETDGEERVVADAKYFVRWRGNVTGPFGAGRIRSMVAQGELTRFHEISADRKDWRQAGEMTEFYPPYEQQGAPSAGSSSTETAAYHLAGEDRSADEEDKDAKQWYYSRGGSVEGPCPWDRIKELVEGGELSQTDHVCPADDSSDWVLVRDILHSPSVAEASFAHEPSAGSGETPAQEILASGLDPSAEEHGRKSYRGMAIAALVLGLLGLCTGVTGIGGIILGVMAKNGMARTGNREGSRMAGAGIGLGVVSIVLGIVAALLWLFVFSGGDAIPGG